tara:strand:- start:2763 stop:2969 length:207 start_codon:yes stop_codon:yes gene_type:complete
MLGMDIPQKYYEQEGFLSLMGIGYTAALAVTGLGLVNIVSKRDMSSVAILGGGALATWGYLKASGVLY